MGSAHDRYEATLYHLEIPLRVPFATAAGTLETRSVGLVSLTRSGHTGWGEAAPYPGQDEPFRTVLEAAQTGRAAPTLSAAIDEAMCDLVARQRGASLLADLGEVTDDVPISLAIGMGAGALDEAQAAWDTGIHRFKVKVMPGATRHVADLRQQLPTAVIGVDANASFDRDTMQQLADLSSAGVAYVEQPTVAGDDPALGRLVDAGLSVFLDESVRSVETAERALENAAVSGVVIKPGRVGWRSSVAIVDMARRMGKQWRASGLLETGIGRSFSLLLAAARDAFVSDVAPAGHFFSYDVAPPRMIGGAVTVPRGHGSGVTVDTEAVVAYAVEVIRISGSAVPDPC